MGNNSRQRGFPVRSEALRTLRTTHTLSQEAAAHRAGVSEKVIRKAEAGGRLDGKSLAALSTVYNTADAPLRAQDLLAGDEPSAAPPQVSSPVEQWLLAIWSEGRLEALDRLAAEHIRFHCEAGCLTTRAALGDRIERIREPFTDFELTIDALAAAGDTLVSRWRISMTHTGAWLGLPPTNQRITALGSTSVRIEGGQIAEGWEFWDPQMAYQELRRRIAGQDSPYHVFLSADVADGCK